MCGRTEFLKMDFQILFKTVGVALKRKGVY